MSFLSLLSSCSGVRGPELASKVLTFCLAESGGLPGTHTNVVDTLLVLLVIVGMRSEG